MLRTFPRGWIVALLAVTATLALSPATSRAQEGRRAWLGVYTQSITSDLRESLDLDEDEGVVVSGVIDGGPADRAGVRKGDVILSYNSRTIHSSQELSELVADSDVGQTIALRVSRNGQHRTIDVELESRRSGDDDAWETPVPRMTPRAPAAPRAPRAPAAPRAPKAPHDDHEHDDDHGEKSRTYEFEFDDDGNGEWQDGDGRRVRRFTLPNGEGMFVAGRGRLGVNVLDANSDEAREYGSSRRSGAMISRVLDGTPAERAGLRAGDVVTRVDGATIADADDLVRAIRNADDEVTLTYVRRGDTRTATIELGDRVRVFGTPGVDGNRIREQIRRDLGTPGVPGTPRVRRFDSGEREELRREIEELRREIEQLRRELEEERGR
jgi:hypothetical protein